LSVSGCSVARLSRLVWDQEVASSNLAIPTYQIPAGSLSEMRGFFVLGAPADFADIAEKYFRKQKPFKFTLKGFLFFGVPKICSFCEAK
jgi:hypothetical protein